MDIRVLKYFLAVAREQSFSVAAERLYLSQPTLSRQLAELEKELGKTLLVRSNKGVTLTEEGMILRKRAEEIVELMEKTEQEVKQSSDSISGKVYIGAGETYAIKLVANAATKLRSEQPDIHFSIYSGDSEDVIEKLDRGILDFGILFEPADISKYESLPLPIQDTWGVLMRRDSPLAAKQSLSAADLEGLPLLISRQQDTAVSRFFGKSTDELNVVARYNLVYNASVMVAEGMGYALTIDKLVNVSGDTPLCFVPIDGAPGAKLNFVWKRYSVFTKAASTFLTQFRQELDEYEKGR